MAVPIVSSRLHEPFDLALGEVLASAILLRPAPRRKFLEISPIFKVGSVTLDVSREKDGKLHMVDAGWDDAKADLRREVPALRCPAVACAVTCNVS
jgi:hypothetical protein